MAKVDLSQKPASIEEYKDWLQLLCSSFFEDSARNQYRAVADRMKEQFEASKFWQCLTRGLRGFDADYRTKTGYDLLATVDVELHVKTFDSFLNKTFRKNVIDNDKWPESPPGGWVTPQGRWYDSMSDIVRARFLVRYLDGVEYLVSRIKETCSQTNDSLQDHWEARNDGYYAVHAYVRQHFTIPG